jgi:hypothetical protein
VRIVSKGVSSWGIRGSALPFLAFALLVLAGCASSATSNDAGAGPTQHTASVAFHPYTATGDLAAKVAHVGRGQCWTTSIAAPAPGSYRCFMGNQILDPCFAAAHPRAPIELACFANPWSKAVKLRVSGVLPEAGTDIAVRPWAFQLVDGTRCVASTGTVPQVAGADLGYHCANGGNAALQQDGGVATARYAAPGAAALRTVEVATLWHA